MLCTTKYYQKDVIVADIVATDVPYRADSSGLTDSTVAIQRALDACRDLLHRHGGLLVDYAQCTHGARDRR